MGKAKFKWHDKGWLENISDNLLVECYFTCVPYYEKKNKFSFGGQMVLLCKCLERVVKHCEIQNKYIFLMCLPSINTRDL